MEEGSGNLFAASIWKILRQCWGLRSGGWTFSIKKLRDAVRLNFERCSATDLNLIRTKIPGLVAALKGACLHEISTLRTPLSLVEAATPGVCTRVETRVIYTRLNVYSHFNIVLYSLSREETISI